MDGDTLRTASSSGSAPGRTVGLNGVVVDRDVALELVDFCLANYAACSLVDHTMPGDPMLLRGRSAIDFRTAASSYDIYEGGYEGGRLVETRPDLLSEWRADDIGIAIGCSLAMDDILGEAGITPLHRLRGERVPVYATRCPTRKVGRFAPALHVSVRVFQDADVERMIAISEQYPALHGGPVAVGDLDALGIDLDAPLFGDPARVGPGETAAAWACGVTLRAALADSGLERWCANSEGALLASPFRAADLRRRFTGL